MLKKHLVETLENLEFLEDFTAWKFHVFNHEKMRGKHVYCSVDVYCVDFGNYE